MISKQIYRHFVMEIRDNDIYRVFVAEDLPYTVGLAQVSPFNSPTSQFKTSALY